MEEVALDLDDDPIRPVDEVHPTDPTLVVTEVDRQGRVNLSRKAAMQRHLAKG